MQKVINQDVFSVYDERKKKKNNTGAERQQNASNLISAEEHVTYLVSNRISTTLAELETVRNAFCQNHDSVDMDHHAFPFSHLRLWAKKLREDVLERFQSVLYELLNDLGVEGADSRQCS